MDCAPGSHHCQECPMNYRCKHFRGSTRNTFAPERIDLKRVGGSAKRLRPVRGVRSRAAWVSGSDNP